MPTSRATSALDVFCNVPFDEKYEPLFLALVAGVLGTGNTPRTVLEIPPSTARVERVLDLLHDCRYSLHDLSRVQLSEGPVRVPRFNMPFELGMAVTLSLQAPDQHHFRLLEAIPFRLQRSLSDLNGYDAYIHHGTTVGMMDAICDVFTHARPFPIAAPGGFWLVYTSLAAFRQARYASKSIYTPDAFKQLVVAGREYVRQFSE